MANYHLSGLRRRIQFFILALMCKAVVALPVLHVDTLTLGPGTYDYQSIFVRNLQVTGDVHLNAVGSVFIKYLGAQDATTPVRPDVLRAADGERGADALPLPICCAASGPGKRGNDGERGKDGQPGWSGAPDLPGPNVSITAGGNIVLGGANLSRDGFSDYWFDKGIGGGRGGSGGTGGNGQMGGVGSGGGNGGDGGNGGNGGDGGNGGVGGHGSNTGTLILSSTNGGVRLLEKDIPRMPGHVSSKINLQGGMGGAGGDGGGDGGSGLYGNGGLGVYPFTNGAAGEFGKSGKPGVGGNGGIGGAGGSLVVRAQGYQGIGADNVYVAGGTGGSGGSFGGREWIGWGATGLPGVDGTISLPRQATFAEVVANSVKTTPDLGQKDHYMTATFTPNFGFTLTEAAKLGGFHHFNWIQRVMSDDLMVHCLRVPDYRKEPACLALEERDTILPESAGGHRGHLPTILADPEHVVPYFDPPLNGGYAKHYAKCGFNDGFVGFWDERDNSACNWLYGDVFDRSGTLIPRYDDTGDLLLGRNPQLYFWDAPKCYPPADCTVVFQTYLAGIRSDGTYAIFPEIPGTSFEWKYTGSPTDTVQRVSDEFDPGDGTATFSRFFGVDDISSDEVNALGRAGIEFYNPPTVDEPGTGVLFGLAFVVASVTRRRLAHGYQEARRNL